MTGPLGAGIRPAAAPAPPLSIALLSYSTKPRGGVVHTLALAEALAGEGQDVTVWTLGRDGDQGFFRPVSTTVRQVVVPFPGIDGEGTGARVLRSIDVLRSAFESGDTHGVAGRGGFDIVHAQDCISANAVGPCVRTVHHVDHFSTPELAACYERAITQPYAHVCVSSAVAAELRDGWGIRAEIIPNGVDFWRFAAAAGTAPTAVQARERWRRRFGRYLLTVGGIEPRKGSMQLLDAYAMLRRKEPDLRLVIAGGETLFDYRDYRAEWDSRAGHLGVQPAVLGPVGHDDLASLVAAADVFVFPSAKEGFGLAALEAMAAGVPVVLSDLPVFREVFAGAARFGGTPAELAAEIRDAMLRPDPARIAAGHELAVRHTWKAAAERHLALYRSLLMSGLPQAPAAHHPG
jgi:glycosyltransferase-like protein